MPRPRVILSSDIGTVSHRKIRAAVKKIRAEMPPASETPVRKITRGMTASGSGSIAFKLPRTSRRGTSSVPRKRG